MAKGIPPSKPLAEPDWLAEQIEAGLSVVEIAQAAGVTDRTVRSAIERHGLPRPRRRPDPRIGNLEAAIGAIRAGATMDEACAAGNVGNERLRRRLKEFGIRPRGREFATSKYPRLNDPRWLAAMLAEGLPLSAIARAVGCDRQVVRDALRRHGLADSTVGIPC
jgi:hypothetical protein